MLVGHGDQEDQREPVVMKDFLFLDVDVMCCESQAGAAVLSMFQL